MKKILFIAGLLIITWNLYAQPAGGMGQMGGAGRSIPNIGHIYGKLIDSTGKAVSDASVILLQSKLDTTTKKRKEVLLKGGATKGNGEFNFEELPVMGGLKLKITATGYKPFEQAISFQPKTNPGAPGAPGGGMPDMVCYGISF